jgi:hypothetical protein
VLIQSSVLQVIQEHGPHRTQCQLQCSAHPRLLVLILAQWLQLNSYVQMVSTVSQPQLLASNAQKAFTVQLVL